MNRLRPQVCVTVWAQQIALACASNGPPVHRCVLPFWLGRLDIGAPWLFSQDSGVDTLRDLALVCVTGPGVCYRLIFSSLG